MSAYAFVLVRNALFYTFIDCADDVPQFPHARVCIGARRSVPQRFSAAEAG